MAFDPFTGIEVAPGSRADRPRAAVLGLEPPRYCAECGRRMVVQVVPDGWTARCSRHGQVESAAGP